MTLAAGHSDQPAPWQRARSSMQAHHPKQNWPSVRDDPRAFIDRSDLASDAPRAGAAWAGPSPWAPGGGLGSGPGAVGRGPDHRGLAWRLGSHLALAALPLLAISAHVFDLVPMHLSAGLLVIPLLVAIVVASLWRPLEQDRMLARAAVVGAVATAVYDIIRLDTVYLLGWWGDFIPSIGAWILNTDDPVTGLVTDPGTAEVLVGYLWRYAGDGAGIGIWFYVTAAALGLRDRGPATTITAAVAFAVAPVWAGLIATVAIAPRAGELMFPLNATTFALSLLGHLIFGLVLGIGAARADRLDRLWPWPRRPQLDAALDWLHGGPAIPGPAIPGSRCRPLGARGRGGGWSAAVAAASPRRAARPGETTNLLPPTIEPRTGAAAVTALVAPIRAAPIRAAPIREAPTRSALPPAGPHREPTPTPPVRALPPSAAAAGPAPPGRSRTGPDSGPVPCPPPRSPISGPVPVPAPLPASPSRPPARRPRPGHEPPVVWGRLSAIVEHDQGRDEAAVKVGTGDQR